MSEQTSSDLPGSGPSFAPLGGHEFAITGGDGPDGGDLVYLRVHDVVELADIKLMLALFQQIGARHPRVFVIIHIVGASGFASEARRYYVSWRKEHLSTNRWVYVISDSVLVRTLIMLVMRGTKLLTGNEPTITMVRSESEALARIAKARGQQS